MGYSYVTLVPLFFIPITLCDLLSLFHHGQILESPNMYVCVLNTMCSINIIIALFSADYLQNINCLDIFLFLAKYKHYMFKNILTFNYAQRNYQFNFWPGNDVDVGNNDMKTAGKPITDQSGRWFWTSADQPKWNVWAMFQSSQTENICREMLKFLLPNKMKDLVRGLRST